MEHDKDNIEISNLIGLSYYYLNDFQNAEKYFLKVLNLNPKQPESYINLSEIYYRQKMYASAIELLLRGKAENPDNMILKHYLARVYMADSRLDSALYELHEILENEPENYDAYYDLGRASFELGNYASAIDCFENILKYKEDNAWVYYYLGEAYEANDEVDKALSNFLKATAVDKDLSIAYKKAAILFLARGENEDAIEYFEDYLNFNIPDEEKKQTENLIKRLKGENE